jgi:RsiW-degrading membrane proteinase PrsW (M82 family)
MSERKNATPVTLAVDLVLCAVFFVIIYSIVNSHVPSRDPKMVLLWSGLTSACMSVVFWMCIQMFRAVLRAQREQKSGN